MNLFNQLNLERFSPAEQAEICRAYEYAEAAHAGQVRKSGEAYITHPVAVTGIVETWGLDAEAMMAALLHDTVEDTVVTDEDIEQQFGSKVSELVKGLTKLALIDAMPGPEASSARHAASKENLRKLLLATSRDYRTLLIKLADRLHNMRTLEHMSQDSQRRIADESLDVYAPLADRLGMGKLKCEIEDLSYRYIDPEGFKALTKVVSKTTKAAAKDLTLIKHEIQAFLRSDGIEIVELEGRQKHLYSISKKLVKTQGDISKIYDLMAIRIIVPDIPACYQVLGRLHQHYKPLIYRIKDYIAVPKPNGYRSLHTTVFATGGRIIEIQIRTPEMHAEAEYGLAAHFFYNEQKGSREYLSGQGTVALPNRLDWVQEMAQQGVSGAEVGDGAEQRLEVFSDRIFAFSPKGDLYDLPEGATAVDFAFAVHSGIGLRTLGAKVNGRMVPLDRPLENRDVVEILTKREPAPNRDWLHFVRTSGARNKIRAWFRSQSREANIASGKALLETELKVWNIKRVEELGDRQVAEAVGALNMKSLDDVLASIGEGSMTPGQAIRRLLPDAARPTKLKVVKRPTSTGKVIFEGENLPYVLAPCCNPVYPQLLIGYVTRGSGVTVHRQGCGNLPTDSDRYIRSRWETLVEDEGRLLCYLHVEGLNRVGLFRDVTSVASDMGFNIGNVRSGDPDHERSLIDFSVEVPDLFVLARLLDRIKRLPGVVDAQHVETSI